MTSVEETTRVAREYFNAWANGDSEGIVEIMADDCTFSSTADGFRIDGRTWPRNVIVRLVAEAYGPGYAFHMYDATHGSQTIRIIEHIRVEDGLVAEIIQACDRATYETFCKG